MHCWTLLTPFTLLEIRVNVVLKIVNSFQVNKMSINFNPKL